MTTEVFHLRFKDERKAQRLTQDEIALICRNREGEALSRAAIAQWEKPGGTRPSFENLVAAARRMGVSIDYLVGLSNVKAPQIHTEKSDAPDDAEVVARQWRRLPVPLRRTVQELIAKMLTSLDGEEAQTAWRHKQ